MSLSSRYSKQVLAYKIIKKDAVHIAIVIVMVTINQN